MIVLAIKLGPVPLQGQAEEWDPAIRRLEIDGNPNGTRKTEEDAP